MSLPPHPAFLRLIALVVLSACTLCNAGAGEVEVARSSNATRKEAFVTLIYGDSYSLAVRVMMHSLYVNTPTVRSGIHDRLVLVTGDTSSHVLDQMRADGLTVKRVPTISSPYTADDHFDSRFGNVLTKLSIFMMDTYSRLVFLDADSLVVGDVSPLFSCGTFCATFINPCFFNAGLMVVTPNKTLFDDMLKKLPTAPSYDGGDQGFLNHYFPQMIHAPLFQWSDKSPKRNDDGMARLPFNWHADHSSYYASLRFQFEDAKHCGPARNMEWLGPPLMKPWQWWTYAALDLSWRWLSYRMQLDDAYTRTEYAWPIACFIIIVSYAILFALFRVFEPHSSPHPSFACRTFMRLVKGIATACCSIFEEMRCYWAILAGVFLWAIGFAVCVVLVPTTLTPLPATLVLVHMRLVQSTLTLVLAGAVLYFRFGNSQAQEEWQFELDTAVSPNAVTKMRKLFWRILVFAFFDAIFLVVCCALMWSLSFSNMWVKWMSLCASIVCQLFLVFVMFAWNSLAWLDIVQCRTREKRHQ